jgi:DNA-binding response OmpR family regulator
MEFQPRMKKTAKPTAKKRLEPSPTSEKKRCRARLLLVEDNDSTRGALQKLLIARNFEVCAASSVNEAWELAEASKFDVLVSDIGLPDGDGFLLMREFKDRFGMSGIALTGYDLEDDFRLSREAGFSVHLTKPVEASVLEEALLSLGL